MDKSPLKIRLKSNPNIAFEIDVQFCSCERIMFLKKNSQDGSVFWSCKGYHQDGQLRLCDLTRDVKCFRCNFGEIRRKQNQETVQFFYGCSNYSALSTAGCNFVLEENEIDDVIEQVNDALKFRYNFKSTQFDSVDEKKWNELNTNACDPKIEKKREFLKIFDFQKFKLPIPTKLASYLASAIIFLGFIAILNGSGVKIDLFQGMFKIEVTPKSATADNVSIEMDPINEEVKVENISDEPVKISDLAILNESGVPVINFEDLPQDKKVLSPNSTLNLNVSDLTKMMNNDYSKGEGSIFDFGKKEENSVPVSDDADYSFQDVTADFISSLFQSNEKMTIAREVVQDGRELYTKITEVQTAGEKLRQDLRKLSPVSEDNLKD